MKFLRRFLEHRAGRRYLQLMATTVPEETRLRIRREAEDGTQPVVHLRRLGEGQARSDDR
jgi:hypothetical protein